MSNDKKLFKFNMEITKRTKIIWGIAIALSIVYGVMRFMEPSPPPRPPKKVESLKGVQGKPAATTQISVQDEVKAVPAESAESVSLYPEGGGIVSGGNLSERTTLRADIELLELQVKKKELLDKLNPPAPAPVSAPPITPGLLQLPPVSGNEPAEPVRKTSSATVVVAVQGVDNNLSAVIRTGGRLISVRKGQTFGGGVITNISRNAVAVRNGNKTSILPFE
jgi:type IV pilus biogenesis protein PilP